MTDITLNNITTGYNLSKINDNFDKIEAVVNDEVLHTTGSNNTMSQQLDMNSNKVINLPVGVEGSDSVNLSQVQGLIQGASSGLIARLKEPTIYATAGQTVVNLTSITYTPNSNNLMVFVNGEARFDYTQADSTSFTFTTGLNLNDRIDVFTNEATTNSVANAQNVTYTAGGADVATALDARPKMFATVADMVADTTLISGQSVIWGGYTTVGDGGGNSGIVMASSDTVDNGSVFASAVAGLQIKASFKGAIDAKQFGILTTSTDISTAFNSMQSLGKDCVMEGGTYKTLSPLIFQSNTKCYNGRVTIDLDSLPANSKGGYCSKECDVIGFDFDGANTTTMAAGYYHELNFEPTRRLILDVLARNITNTDPSQSATGCLLVIFTNALDPATGLTVKSAKVWARLEAHNITATADGIIGNSAGSAKGVGTSFNGSGASAILADVILDNPRASKIYPSEDADGIGLFDGDMANLDSRSIYRVVNPKSWDCAKRGFKVQAPNTVIHDMYVDLDLNDGVSGTALALETLGVNTTLVNPVIVGKTNATGDGSIRVTAANFKCTNPSFHVAYGQNLLRMGNGAIDYEIKGGSIYSTGTYASNTFSMILVEDNASGVIDIGSINVTTRTASAIRYQGATLRNSITIKGLCQAETLLNIAFSAPTADIHLSSYQGDYSGDIITSTGDDGTHTVHALYGSTSGANIAICTPLFRFMGNGDVTSVSGGIFFNGLSIPQTISGAWKLTSTAGTGNGVNITGMLNGLVSGVETSGYANHIIASFSTNCALVNNIGRGAGTHITATTTTGLVQGNNFITP